MTALHFALLVDPAFPAAAPLIGDGYTLPGIQISTVVLSITVMFVAVKQAVDAFLQVRGDARKALQGLVISAAAEPNLDARPKGALYWYFLFLAICGALLICGLAFVYRAVIISDPARDLWLGLYGVFTLTGVGTEFLQTCQEQHRAPDSVRWWDLLPPLVLSLAVYYSFLVNAGSDSNHFRACVIALLTGYAWRRILSAILKNSGA